MRTRIGLLAAAVLAIGACGGPGEPTITVTSVDVSPSTGSVKVGLTITLTATPKDQNGGAVAGRTITWSSSNPAVASVSNTGVVSGVTVGGPITITATADGQSGSAQISVTPGDPSQVTITTQPSATAQSGAALAQQPAVQLRDAAGNAVNAGGINVTASVASGSATLLNASALTNLNGVATFTGLTLTGAAGNVSLSFAATGLTPAVSNAIALTAGSATKLSITTQPSTTGQVATPLAQQPAVQLLDASNNPVSTAGVTVTATLGSGTGTVAGNTAVTNASGLATFSGLAISGATGSYTLAFNSSGLVSATSTAITLLPGPVSQLTVTQQPSSSVQNGVPFPQQPVVSARDAGGNVLSGVVVAATIATGGGTLSGVLSITTDPSGFASFPNLAITGTPGGRTLRFTSGSVNVVSNTVDVTAGTATRLNITTQPSSSAQSGVAFTQQPAVQLQDASGNSVPQSGVTVTAELATGTGTLASQTAQTNGTGLATFSGLSITGAAGSYSLRFTSGALTPAGPSNAITLTAGTATQLSITTQPSANAQSGVAIPVQPVVQLRDGAGNAVSQAGVTVNATIESSPGGTPSLANSSAVTNASGQASFSGLAITGVAGNYTLRFGSAGLTGIVSSQIALGAGGATQLTIITQPSSNGQSGVALPQQPVIQLNDASGNPVTPGSNVTVNAVIATSPGGTPSLSNASAVAVAGGNGRATFSGLAINGLVGNYTLRFESTGLTPVVSNGITVAAGTASQLTITTQPSSTASSGVAFPQQPAIQIRDAAGNTVSQAGFVVSASIASSPGGGPSLSNSSANTNASGLATFSGLAINGINGNYTLRFQGTGVSDVVSNTVALVPTLSGKIAFDTQRDGNSEIYIMNTNGTSTQNLTNNGSTDERPAVSPNGQKIAFSTNRDGNFEIYVMNADGGSPVRLTNNAGTDTEPTWSPDGTKIAFSTDRDGNFEIYVMNADGSNQVRLTNDGSSDGLPAWSPDGTKIAFDSDRGTDRDIYVMNAADGTNVVQLTNAAGSDFRAAWSPNGSQIAFTSERDGNREIYTMNANGSSQTNISQAVTSSDLAPSWSRDGSKISFASNRNGPTEEIFTMNSGGGGTSGSLGSGLATSWSP